MGNRVYRALQLACCALLALTLTSCATKFAYNHLDWALGWKVKRLVDLDGALEQQTERAIDSFLDWHRATELPQYVDFLQETQKRIAAGELTATDVSQQSQKAQVLVEQSLAKLLPDIVSVLSRLDQAQVDELLESIAEEREEYIDEHVDMSPEKQVKKRYDKFEKRFKDWLGGPTRKQRQQILSWAKNLETYEAETAKQQKLWQQQLAELLAERQDVKALAQGLEKLIFHRSDSWDKNFKRIIDGNEQRTYELLANLLNNTTERQQAHLNKEIDDYSKTFTELHREAK